MRLYSLALLCAAVCPAQNLVMGPWTAWSPRPELKPEMAAEGGRLRIASNRYGAYGKWMTVVRGVRAGQSYRLEAPYAAQGIESETTSLTVILTWCTDESCREAVQRDYARPDGAGRFTAVLAAPAGAAVLRVELGLKWSDRGRVEWRQPVVAAAEAPKPRRVRLATTHLVPPRGATVEDNVRLMGEAIDRAAKDRPDLVVLSENFVDRGVARPLDETAQTIPGPATEALGAKARQYRTYIATSLHEREGDLFYNTAVLIDREGKVAGRYRKVHLTMIEADMGMTAGREYPVFTTDFGRVGLLTCWDNWFTETARVLALRGAEVLALPIAGDGVPGHWDVISRARAMDNGVFLVSSNTVGTSSSRIVTPEGKVVAETLDPAGVVSAEVDLDAAFRVPWLSVGPGLGDARDLYFSERRPETYGPLQGGRK